MSGFHFRPADTFTDRHGLFIALVGGTNSGKSFSALRLARGIAGPTGKIAVLDTEGGRTLHLKEKFKFDAMIMDPPFRPHFFAEAAKSAEDAGYDVLLIDSFSMEWAGMGGVLDWQSEELLKAVERQRAMAASKGWNFDENKAMNANKLSSWIEPKMGHKAMVYSFLQRRMPIIFSIRAEESVDPDNPKKKLVKSVCNKQFPFEVTVSFRLAADRKGIIDLSDPEGWKMEGAHREIFRDGDQLSERHGEALTRWASGGAKSDALSEEADAAALKGVDAYRDFFGGLSKDQQRAILPDHAARKERAQAVTTLAGCKTVEDLDEAWELLPGAVCAALGADMLDTLRAKLTEAA